MGVLQLTATDTEVFGVGVLEAYQHRDYIQEDWLLFEGMTAGELINVPVFQTVIASNKPDGESHAGAATMLGSEVPLFNPIKAFVDIAKTQADIRPDLNLLTNTGRALGRAVGYGRTLRIANGLIKGASGAGNAKQAANLNGDTVRKTIELIAAEMDDDGVDEGTRYGLLKPSAFYALRSEPAVISSDFTQGQNRNNEIGGNMAMVEYLGYMIRNCGGVFGINFLDTTPHGSKNLPADLAFDNTKVVGVFWHTECAVVRHQTGLEAAADWFPREQVWITISRLHMGFKVIKTDGVWIMTVP